MPEPLKENNKSDYNGPDHRQQYSGTNLHEFLTGITIYRYMNVTVYIGINNYSPWCHGTVTILFFGTLVLMFHTGFPAISGPIICSTRFRRRSFVHMSLKACNGTIVLVQTTLDWILKYHYSSGQKTSLERLWTAKAWINFREYFCKPNLTSHSSITKHTPAVHIAVTLYSKTSMTRTRMTRLPCLIRTRFWIPMKFSW